MRADRLISLLMLLQAHNGLTARHLADELEVSERTIYRDLTALSAAGIPVYTQSGPGGGCFLLEDYRTNLTGLNSEQAQALFMLSIPAPLDQLGFSQDLKAALLKLSAALPHARRNDEEQTRQRLYLDWGFDAARDGAVPHLKVVQESVWQDRLLRISYRSLFSPWIEAFEQVAAPHGLVAWAGDWYLVCFWDGQGHVIRLSLIEKVEVLPELFSRDPGFELPKFWLEWRRQYETDKPVYPVRARVEPHLAKMLRHFQGDPADEQGWITGVLRFETFETARARILSYGGAVQVLEPEALRCSVLDFAAQIVARYGKEEP
jgi:predicted DNA-binding transcriptional regulator YafY